MLGMKIIASIFLDKMRNMEQNAIVQEFDYFKDDIPHIETLPSELLQWRASSFLLCELMCNTTF